MEPIKDASHLYEVERRARHAERPGFRINELQISATQQVPWHFHSNIQDTFYIIEGQVRLFLREPKEEVRLGPGTPILSDLVARILSPMAGMTQPRSSSFRASASTITFRWWNEAEPAQMMLCDPSNYVALVR